MSGLVNATQTGPRASHWVSSFSRVFCFIKFHFMLTCQNVFFNCSIFLCFFVFFLLCVSNFVYRRKEHFECRFGTDPTSNKIPGHVTVSRTQQRVYYVCMHEGRVLGYVYDSGDW